MTNQEKVKEFHKKYDIPVRDNPTKEIPKKESDLRLNLFGEEVLEFVKTKSIAEQAKEAADILYILYGTAATYGYDLDQVFDLVHKSNMTKEKNKRSDGKLLKGDSYIPPDLSFLE